GHAGAVDRRFLDIETHGARGEDEEPVADIQRELRLRLGLNELRRQRRGPEVRRREPRLRECYHRQASLNGSEREALSRSPDIDGCIVDGDVAQLDRAALAGRSAAVPVLAGEQLL